MSSVPLDVEKIRKLREKLKLTMDVAAERAGMKSRQRWYEVESGRNANVTLATLEAIARTLNVKARDLLLDEG